jgi:hypothetical protein
MRSSRTEAIRNIVLETVRFQVGGEGGTVKEWMRWVSVLADCDGDADKGHDRDKEKEP